MSWTYSGDPTSSNNDAVRFEIGDTDSNDPLVTDEEIAFTLEAEGGVVAAAARCCETLARKYARQVDYVLGPQQVKASQRSKAFIELGKDLRRRATAISQGNGLYVGGIDPTDEAKDTNLIPPAFKRRFMDNI